MTPLKACIVCCGKNFDTLFSLGDTNQDVPGRWSLQACQHCRTGVLDPFPSMEELNSFYRGCFYTDEGQRFRGWMEFLRSIISGWRARTLNRLMPERGRLLDFGSGAGHFARAQRRTGWHVDAIDPHSSASTEIAFARPTEDGFTLQYPDNYFDAITLWYVIEHLRDPASAIVEFHRVLKPGGILVLAQQDFNSLQARVFGRNWLYLDIPRHVWQFTSNSLPQLAKKYGFTLEQTNWASLEMGPYCILQSTLNAIVGNNNDLFRLLKNRHLPQSTVDSVSTLRTIPTVVSLLLLPALLPVVLLCYFVLLGFKQGDVFEIYLRRE
jgi:SAM-dependent methyltransferase